MLTNLHPLVVALCGDHPVTFSPEPLPYALLSGSGACIRRHTQGACWARCDYAWTWFDGHDEAMGQPFREFCGALAGLMPDGVTWRCCLHEMYWFEAHEPQEVEVVVEDDGDDA